MGTGMLVLGALWTCISCSYMRSENAEPVFVVGGAGGPALCRGLHMLAAETGALCVEEVCCERALQTHLSKGTGRVLAVIVDARQMLRLVHRVENVMRARLCISMLSSCASVLRLMFDAPVHVCVHARLDKVGFAVFRRTDDALALIRGALPEVSGARINPTTPMTLQVPENDNTDVRGALMDYEAGVRT